MGTIIIVNKKIHNHFTIHHHIVTAHRTQMLSITSGKNKTIINIQSGNTTANIQKRIKQIEEIEAILKNHTHQKVIIGGDFNFVEEIIDTTSKHFYKSKDIAKWIEFRQHYKLKYVYRHNNLLAKMYTFISKKSATRIDRFYVNSENNKSENIKHIPVTFTDHTMVPIIESTIEIKDRRWGKGTLKLNKEILESKQNKININYQIDKLQQINHNFEDISKWWEQNNHHFNKGK